MIATGLGYAITLSQNFMMARCQRILENERDGSEKLISELAQLCYNRQHLIGKNAILAHCIVSKVSSSTLNLYHQLLRCKTFKRSLQHKAPALITGIRIGLAAAHGFKCTAYQSVYAINRCDLDASIAMKKWQTEITVLFGMCTGYLGKTMPSLGCISTHIHQHMNTSPPHFVPHSNSNYHHP